MLASLLAREPLRLLSGCPRKIAVCPFLFSPGILRSWLQRCVLVSPSTRFARPKLLRFAHRPGLRLVRITLGVRASLDTPAVVNANRKPAQTVKRPRAPPTASKLAHARPCASCAVVTLIFRCCRVVPLYTTQTAFCSLAGGSLFLEVLLYYFNPRF